MKNRDKVLDDIARVAGGTVSVFSGITQSIREEIKTRVDEMSTRLDLVPREDFEKLETMLAEARKAQQAQEKRIAALEKKAGIKTTTTSKPTAKKKTTKKAAAKKTTKTAPKKAAPKRAAPKTKAKKKTTAKKGK